MGFRFKKSVKIAPGVRLKIGKKGTSVTVGNKYARTTIGKKKTTVSASIPGTGLSYVKQVSNKSNNKGNTQRITPPSAPPSSYSNDKESSMKIIKWAFYVFLGFIIFMMFTDSPMVIFGAILIVVGIILSAKKKNGQITMQRPWLITTFGWVLALILWMAGFP